MPVIRAQVSIPYTTQAPAEVMVNSWAFYNANTDATTLDGIDAALRAWYDSWTNYRSSDLLPTGARLKMYDMSQPKPRPPIRDTAFGITTTTGTGKGIAEVAITMTFQADRLAGVPQARRRGRIYVGPLAGTAYNTSTGRPDTTFLNTIVTAGAALLDASDNSPYFSWVVHSTVNLPPNDWAVVTNGWVDNAWDTQRRRGLPPTTRTTFTQGLVTRIAYARGTEPDRAQGELEEVGEPA